MLTQDEIAKEIKLHYPDIKEKDTNAIQSAMFRSTANLRLTRIGMTLYAGANHTAFTYKHDNALLPKHLMGISRQIQSPYYLTPRLFIIFSEGDALMIKLCGGLGRFIETLE